MKKRRGSKRQRLLVRGRTELCPSLFTSVDIIRWWHLAAREAGQGVCQLKRTTVLSHCPKLNSSVSTIQSLKTDLHLGDRSGLCWFLRAATDEKRKDIEGNFYEHCAIVRHSEDCDSGPWLYIQSRKLFLFRMHS